MAVKKKEEPIEEESGFDIFKSKLVPKSRILSEEEVTTLLTKYNISKQQLPRILAIDSVAKVLKAKPGQVIEFERTNKSAGLSNYYRILVGGT